MIMKGCIYFLLVIGLVYCYPVWSQTVYFNKTIDLEGEWGAGMSIIANDTSYYLAGLAGPGYNICIVKVRLNGNVNWIKKYGKSNEAWYPGNPGSLYESYDGSILGGAIETPDTTYGLFMKFNRDFDLY